MLLTGHWGKVIYVPRASNSQAAAVQEGVVGVGEQVNHLICPFLRCTVGFPESRGRIHDRSSWESHIRKLPSVALEARSPEGGPERGFLSTHSRGSWSGLKAGLWEGIGGKGKRHA